MTSDASSPEGAAPSQEWSLSVVPEDGRFCAQVDSGLPYEYAYGLTPLDALTLLCQVLGRDKDAPALSRPQAPTDQRIAEIDDFDWARARVESMCASALIDASRLGKKILKGFGYPDEIFSRAQDYRALSKVLDALTVLQQRVEQLDNECRTNTHELMLIAKDTERGITDCSTPLFQRVQNIVEMLTAAEQRLEAAERERANIEQQAQTAYRIFREEKEAAEATIASLREAMNAHRLTCKTGGPNPDAIAALPSSSVARTAETEEP